MELRSAIVTGAGSGIGRATALQLAARGFAVGLVGRRKEPLDSVAHEIQRTGGNALAVVADVTAENQVEAATAEVLRAWRRIDALVNGAGNAPVVPLAELSTGQWHEILESNLSSAFYLTRAVWPIMRRQFANSGSGGEGGVIVNISSMASKDPFPGLGAYGAAKVALNMLTTVWAREGKDLGIRVIGIAPAAVETPMLRKVLGDKSMPEESILQPEEVARMIGEAIDGSLRNCSGETIFVHRQPA